MIAPDEPLLGFLKGDRLLTIVDAIVPTGKKPYWAVASPDGRHCFLSNSDSDDVSVISFDNPAEVTRIPVGDHPQRVRGYPVPQDALTR